MVTTRALTSCCVCVCVCFACCLRQMSELFLQRIMALFVSSHYKVPVRRVVRPGKERVAGPVHVL